MVKLEDDAVRTERNLARLSKAEAEEIAGRALGVLAADEDRLWRFLDLTGLTPGTLRAAAARPGFAAAVLDHVVSDEGLLLDVAEALGLSPERVARAQALLSPQAFED